VIELSDKDQARITKWEYKIGLPTALELLGEDEDILKENWEDGDGSGVYSYLLSSAPGTKVGGYVSWIQDPEVPTCRCGNLMEHLLTIDSAEFDGGNNNRWCPIEDEHVWTADWREIEAVQAAAGLVLGDMGSVYIFVCRNCQPWRTASVMQFT
jgi:hypothetical protein